jgi:hypothetical protein
VLGWQPNCALEVILVALAAALRAPATIATDGKG